jgi:hypothetical protein
MDLRFPSNFVSPLLSPIQTENNKLETSSVNDLSTLSSHSHHSTSPCSPVRNENRQSPMSDKNKRESNCFIQKSTPVLSFLNNTSDSSNSSDSSNRNSLSFKCSPLSPSTIFKSQEMKEKLDTHQHQANVYPSPASSEPKFGSESKIKKLLGESPTSPLNQQKTFSFLSLDYIHTELSSDGRGKIQAASLNALIEQLTRHDLMDPDLVHCFLSTFSLYVSKRKVFQLLKARFHEPMPFGLDREEAFLWKEKKQSMIRLQ